MTCLKTVLVQLVEPLRQQASSFSFYIKGTNKAIFLADGNLEDGNTIGVMALAAGSAIEAEVKELTPFDKAQEYFRRAAKVKAIYRKPGEARK